MRRLSITDDVNIKKLVDMTEGATGADIKAICTEAGMFAIRKDAEIITAEDFIKAANKVLNKLRDAFVESRLYS
jgi:proteasome regulatory subunit